MKADVQRQNSETPNPAPTNGNVPSDGLLIHLDNGNIVAEPVGLGDRELRDQYPSDGRRMVIGEGQNLLGDMPDIVEEGAITPHSALTPSLTAVNTKINGGQLAPPDEETRGGHGPGGEVVAGVSFADAVRHGGEEADALAESAEDEGNGGDLSRKNSQDRLLG